MMLYLKSIVAGLLACVFGLILGIIALIMFVRLRFGAQTVSVDVRIFRSPMLGVVLLLLFLAGFAFEFRHG